MKHSIFLALLATCICVSGEEKEAYRVELLDPRGFRVLRPSKTDLSTIRFHGSINPVVKVFSENVYQEIAFDEWDFSEWFDQWTDGTWAYQNTNASLNPGDTLYFEVEEYITDYVLISDPKEFHIPADASRVPVGEHQLVISPGVQAKHCDACVSLKIQDEKITVTPIPSV